MNEQEALILFAEDLENPCPLCGKPAGVLCATDAVWVHVERFIFKEDL